MSKKYIYFFGAGKADGKGTLKELLGGKGAGLAEMSRSGVPVPPGFTITTEVCRYYMKGESYPAGFETEFRSSMEKLQNAAGKRFGDAENSLLVSVRSGAKFSMPGMMDTILNLGMNDPVVEGVALSTGNSRFAWDAYRRFIQMFGNVVMSIDKGEFEKVLDEVKHRKGVRQDADLSVQDLQETVRRYRALYREKTGRDFPQDPWEQLRGACEAVFKSWNNPRAQTYRRLNKIPDDLGTACNVQAMVFGNMGATSATGVGFTRSPSNGEKKFYGEYLPNAQGEDVVAGIRTPQPIQELKNHLPGVYRQLRQITSKLERHYRDIQDFEFTVEKGRLYMLQTRTGKRTAAAALRIAVDMVREKLITREEAVLRVEPDQLDQLLKPVFDVRARQQFKALAKGLPAGPGAACGRVVFTADKAVEDSRSGPVILVRPETNPDDIHGMSVSEGILTATGGLTSHAAVVGRGMGKVCVVGCGTLDIREEERLIKVNGTTIQEGEFISIDGFTGEVILGKVPTQPSEILRVVRGEMSPKESSPYLYYQKFMGWVDEFRRLGVRANADIPRDAQAALALGAEGIGLCRTEHMFFGEDRIPKMVKMIVARDEASRRKALDELFPLQKEDFKGLLKTMEGFPVTIRTLDPPLHEFLPHTEEEARHRAAQIGLDWKDLWAKSQELKESNPMLGHRGCRLGITYPEITEMQTRAILSAACELAREGVHVYPEIMIPLVGFPTEFAHQRAVVERVAQETIRSYRVQVHYTIGTMIEVPRAALVADAIAQTAEFFSFGTNDLTQMTLGYSRDDYGKFVGSYIQEKILKEDPFQTLDVSGVGQLIRMGVQRGRSVRKKLKVGICGEHGGDPSSIHFCHEAGLDYVSCSPYRVPVARLASARASVLEKRRGKEMASSK